MTYMISPETLNEIVNEANAEVRNARIRWRHDYSTKLGIEDYIDEARMRAVITAMSKLIEAYNK